MKKLIKNIKGLSKKNKIIASSLIGVVVVGLIAGSVALLANQEETIVLKKEVFTIEYGTLPATKASDYISNTTVKVLEESKVTFEVGGTYKEAATNEKDKKFPAVGTIKGMINYNKQELPFTIEVKDTVAPIFKDFKEEIKIEQDSKDIKYDSYFKAEDLSKVTITVDSKKVDLSKVGSYEITITANDASKNKVEKKSKIIVTEKPKEVEKTDTPTTNADGTTNEGSTSNGTTSGGTTSGGNTSGGSTSGGATSGGTTSGGTTTSPSTPAQPSTPVSPVAPTQPASTNSFVSAWGDTVAVGQKSNGTTIVGIYRDEAAAVAKWNSLPNGGNYGDDQASNGWFWIIVYQR